MNRKTVTIAVILLAWVFGFVYFALGLTPREREKSKLILSAIEKGIAHNQALQAAAEQSDVIAQNALGTAKLAVDSAQTSETKAKLAEALEKRQGDELIRCATENAEMRPIVKAVSGPWWFPGGRALLYGAKKSAKSLVVIIAGLAVIGILLKIFAPGVFAGIKLGGKAAASLGGRAAATVKRLLKRKPKS